MKDEIREEVSPLRLFRKAAIEAAADTLARPLGIQEPAGWLLSGFFVVCATVLLGFLSKGTYTRRETATGTLALTAGTPNVIALRSGIIQTLRSSNGSRVIKGDVLFVIRSDLQSSVGENVTEQVDVLRRAQNDSEHVELLTTLDTVREQKKQKKQERLGLTQQLAYLRNILSIQRLREESAASSIHDIQPLVKEELISRTEVKRYESLLLDAKEAIASTSSQFASTRTQLQQTESAIAAFDNEIESSRARVQAQSSKSEADRLTLLGEREFAVVAPVSGILTGITYKVGESVGPGTALAVVVPPESELYADLRVPSRAIGFARVDDRVKVMIDAFPFQKFGFSDGVVSEISLAPIARSIQADQEQGPVYQVRVKLVESSVAAYGKRWPLTPGMAVQADIILEKRSFIEWLLDPLRATAARL